jgi:hypothetical protein|tara:strand:- start:149 stop:391 length:243 start_codon:yes stop_codon:yes gene_type:complete
MATNWTVQTSSKASTTDNFIIEAITQASTTDDFTVETLTKPFWEWDNQGLNWENITDIWNLIGKSVTWTISNKAVTKDTD